MSLVSLVKKIFVIFLYRSFFFVTLPTYILVCICAKKMMIIKAKKSLQPVQVTIIYKMCELKLLQL